MKSRYKQVMQVRIWKSQRFHRHLTVQTKLLWLCKVEPVEPALERIHLVQRPFPVKRPMECPSGFCYTDTQSIKHYKKVVWYEFGSRPNLNKIKTTKARDLQCNFNMIESTSLSIRQLIRPGRMVISNLRSDLRGFQIFLNGLGLFPFKFGAVLHPRTLSALNDFCSCRLFFGLRSAQLRRVCLRWDWLAHAIELLEPFNLSPTTFDFLLLVATHGVVVSFMATCLDW